MKFWVVVMISEVELVSVMKLMFRVFFFGVLELLV